MERSMSVNVAASWARNIASSCNLNSGEGTQSGVVCSLVGETQSLVYDILLRKRARACPDQLAQSAGCGYGQKHLQRQTSSGWRFQSRKAVLCQGVKAAGNNQLAEEDLYEDVTAEEDEFHHLTKKGSAYWSNLMQAVSSDGRAQTMQEASSHTEPSHDKYGESQRGIGSDTRNREARGLSTSAKTDGGVQATVAQDMSEVCSSSFKEELKSEVKIPLKQLLQFERKGHAVVRQLVPEAVMEAYAEDIWSAAREQELDAYRHRVAVLCAGFDASSVGSVDEALDVLSEHGTDELGFVQMFNMHRYSRAVHDFVTSPRLARVAADFLGVSRVRLYQDCLFLKQPGFGATNWHSDLNMVPLDTNSFVTLWIPLREMDDDDSGLLFASGSHRDFSLAYWQSEEGMEDLERREYPLEEHGALELGDATCHHGWCLHYAMPQPDEADARAALSISYFADGARVLDTRHARRKPHDEDAWSYRGWRESLREGDLADHPLLPLVYPPELDERPAENRKRRASQKQARQQGRYR